MMNNLKSFIVLYGGKFIRVYKENEVDKILANKSKEASSNMFEIKIKGRLYIFNKASIAYILLGDGSVPSDKAMRVTIVFNSSDIKQFCFDDYKSAQELYDKIKQQVQPSTEKEAPMPCNGKKTGGKKPPKK